MTAVLLSVHVLAAILAVGPIAVAASIFPRVATAAGPTPSSSRGTGTGTGTGTGGAVLHRICRVYAVVGVAVPVFGIATGVRMGVMGDAWVTVSIVLTLAAAAILGLAVLPGQRRLLAEPADRALVRRLGMTTGVFNLLWAVVVVLMIARPGSSMGAAHM